MAEKFRIRDLVRIGDAVTKRRNPRIEPQKSYMFDVEFFDHTNHVPSFESIKFHIKNLSIPSRNKEVIQRPFMQKNFQYAGRDSSEKKITISFWEDEGRSVYDYINRWYSLSGEEITGDSATKKNYTKDILVSLRDTNDFLITSSFRFINAFPVDIGEQTLSYDSSEPLTVDVSFVYDYVVHDDGLDSNLSKVRSVLDSIDSGAFTDLKKFIE